MLLITIRSVVEIATENKANMIAKVRLNDVVYTSSLIFNLLLITKMMIDR